MQSLNSAVRRWSAIGRVARVLLGATLLTTCSTDSALAPHWTAQSTIDATAFFRAGGAFPIPVDEVILDLRRVSDNSLAFSDTLTAQQFQQSGGQLLITLSVDLKSATEQFTFTAIVRGGGVEYYRTTGTVTATAGQATQTTPLTPTYTGPGSTADSVTIPATTTLGNGQSATITATVWQGLTPITGVPVSFESSDSALITPQSTGFSQASVTAPATGTGSVTVTARTPGGLSATGTVAWAPAASAIIMVSGNGQSVPAGSAAALPLVVKVQDGLGNPVAGIGVTFAVATGPAGTTVAPTTATTDNLGLAQTTLTAGSSAGPITVTATSAGLTGSPISFTATATTVVGPPASVTANSALTQNATVGTAVGAPPSVLVLDANANPVPGVAVTFAVASGGGSLTGGSATTDGAGVATVLSWTVGATPGPNTLTATVASLPPVTFTATGVTAAPATVTANSNTSQNAVANTLVAAPPSVLVKDAGGAPLAGVTVTFAVVSGGGSITGPSQVTNASGIASVTNWRLGQTVGANSVTATVASLTPVVFSATGTPTAILTLAKDSGDAQSDSAGKPLPVELVVQAIDSFANVVPGATVNWTVTDGSVAPTTGTTDASGRARTTWTLGSTLPNPTATATVGSLQAVFTATTLFSSPTIQLSFAGVPGVGIGLTSKVYITLNAAAPVGGTVVSLASGNTSFFTVPASVTVAQGKVLDSVLVTGVSPGTALLTASAAGFTDGTLSVDVQNRNISVLPTTLNVPYNGTASLVINLPAPAPVGGVVFAVTSSNPTAVGLGTPSVTIAAGLTSANVTVQGLLPGTSTVTVNNAAFTSAFSTVTTSASLNVLQGSTALNASFPIDIDIQFESNSIAIAAPTGGVPVTLIPRNPACVTSNSPRTILAGLVSVQATLSAATGPFPCTTYVVATATNIQPDSVLTTVNAQPGFNVPGTTTIGSGLQTSAFASLQASNHGGTTVRVTSSDPSKLLIAPNATTVGSAFVDLPIPVNNTGVSYYLQAVDGQTGNVTVSYSAPGFQGASNVDSLVAPAIDVIFLPTTATVFQPNSAFQVRLGYPNAARTAMQTEQARRFGVVPDTITVINDSAAVATLVTSAQTASVVQVLVQPGQARSGSPASAGGVEFKPLNAGVTQISASGTAYISLPQPLPKYTVTVSTPALSLNPFSAVGSGQQIGTNGFLGASNHGGVTVHLTSSDPTKFLLAPNGTTVGSGTLDIVVLNGNTGFSYTVQALEGQVGTATITATAPGFTTATTTATAVAPAVDVIFLPSTIASLAPNAAFQARIGIPNGQLTAIQAEFGLRAGSPGLTVTFAHSDPTAGKLFTTALTADTVTAPITALNARTPSPASSGGVEYDPVAPGFDTVTATIPGYVVIPTATQPITVTGQAITLNGVSTMGSGMQVGSNGFLGASNHGGVTVHLVVSDSSKFLIAPNGSTVGTGSLDIPVANGNTGFGYTLQALEGQVGTATLTATAPGFTTANTTLTAVQPALDVIFLPTSTTTFSANAAFQVRIGTPNAQLTAMQQEEALRAGSPGMTVSLASSVPGVGALVTLAGSSGTGQVNITALNARSPGGVPAGGIEFDPIIGGTTTVSATSPGYVVLPTASVAVTVNAPAITLSNNTVGAGLQVPNSGFLGAANHGGVTVRVTSSQPSVALVSPNASTAGTPFIDVFVPNGSTSFTWYLQGVEGQTGAPAITASAPGFTDGSATATVVPAALDIIFLNPNTTTLTPNNAFQVRLGYANSNNTAMAAEQVLRAGGTVRTATVTNSNAAVGQLFFQSGAAQAGTVDIALQQARSPSPASAGGVEFSALTAGTTTVSATIPGFLALPTATQTVNVTTPIINVSSVTVGAGLQIGSFASLGASNHGGTTVRVASNDPSLFLIAPNATTAGSAFIDVPLANGNTGVSFVVQGLEGVTGSASVTISAPGYTNGVATETVVQPSVDIIFLPTTIASTAANVAFQVRTGTPDALGNSISQEQAIRFGGSAATATVSTTNSTAGLLVNSLGSGLTVQTVIPIGSARSPNGVASGGIEFDPLAPGQTAVSVTIPGFRVIPSSTQSVTIQ